MFLLDFCSEVSSPLRGIQRWLSVQQGTEGKYNPFQLVWECIEAFPVIQTLQYCFCFHLSCFLPAGEDSGSTLNSAILDFCFFHGCHTFLAWSRGAAVPARGLVAEVVPLILQQGRFGTGQTRLVGTALFRMPLFPLCLLCDYLAL